MKLDRRSFLRKGLATGTLGATALSLAGRAAAKDRDRDMSKGKSDEARPAQVNEPRVTKRVIKENGPFPNSRLPLLVYRGVLTLPPSKDDAAAAIEALIHQNGWGNDWRDGIFTYHHYHSTAHECLLVYSGSARVQLGGEGGVIESIAAGDVVVIPAGVGHKNVGDSGDLKLVGAYPRGQEPDMCYGRPDERPRTDRNIARVPAPTSDPVFGKSGPLLELWRSQS